MIFINNLILLTTDNWKLASLRTEYLEVITLTSDHEHLVAKTYDSDNRLWAKLTSVFVSFSAS